MKTIIYFLPAILSTEKERNEKDTTFKVISIYAKYCILINLFMLIILSIISWFIPIVLNLFKKNFSIKIKGKNNEKK